MNFYTRFNFSNKTDETLLKKTHERVHVLKRTIDQETLKTLSNKTLLRYLWIIGNIRINFRTLDEEGWLRVPKIKSRIFNYERVQ